MTGPESPGLPADLIAVLAAGAAETEQHVDVQALLEACVKHVPAFDAGTVLERTGDGMLHFVAAEGFDLDLLSELTVEPSALFPSQEGGMRLGPRLNDEALSPADRATLLSAGTGTMPAASVSVALRPGGRLLGYLQFDAFESEGFGLEERAIAGAMGAMLSARLERADLRRRLDRALEDVERISTHDPVTELPNRELLLDRLGQAVARDQRAERTTALLVVGVRDMHRINDAYGHDRGQDVLRKLSRLLALATRDMDTVAHLGNGEFAVLASDIDEIQAAEALVERIRNLSDQPLELDKVTLHPRLALGIALFPTDGASPRELLRNAELALTRALSSDRKPVAWFMRDVDREQRERSRLAEELRAALVSGQGVWVAFQPIHRMSDGATLGIEALARWDRASDRDAMVPPSVFGPLTEELGLTHELSARVYARAFSVFSSLKSIRGTRPWRLALNLSATQLRDDDLAMLLEGLSESHDVPIEELDLEVPAPIIFEASAPALQRLRTLRELGCRIAVDDFAAYRDEIDRLEGLPIDALKIHPRWTRSLHEEAAQRRVAGIVSASKRLGLDLVAEGVESPDAAQRLAKLGVDAIQGFVATPPMHAAALLAYLSTRSLLG